MPNTEETTEEKVDLMLGMLIQMQQNVNKLETESAEVRSLLSLKDAKANEKGENQKPNPDGEAAGGTNSNGDLEMKKGKALVDQEAMDLMERMYTAEMETEIDEATGEPVKVFVEDSFNFNTVAVPMLIKKEIMMKKQSNPAHNGKIKMPNTEKTTDEKVDLILDMLMKVKDNVTKLETESTEVWSLLSLKDAKANEKGENQKPNPDGEAAGGTNSNGDLEGKEEKVLVDQEAMDLRERI